MLRDLLIARLAETFGADAFTTGDASDLVATFAAAHPDVGPVEVWGSGSGAIVSIPDITHGHFDDFTEGITDEAWAASVAASVTEFLQDLFADKYVLWKDSGGGGWWHVEYNSGVPEWAQNARTFVWSGPWRTDK